MARRRLTLAWMGIVTVVVAACSASTAPTPSASAAAAATTPTASSIAAPSPAPTPMDPPTPTPSPGPTFEADVPFTPPIPCAADPAWEDAICQLQFDIAAPPPATGTHPIAVLLRGGPDKPHAIDYMADTARALADRGIVAMVADWRESPEYAGGGRTALGDVACAIGVARRLGPAYGGDPRDVTVVGHSFGAWSGGIVALSRETFMPATGECNETDGALRPEAFVGMEGWLPEEVWSVAAKLPKHPLPVLVVHAEGDGTVPVSVARDFVAALRKRGYAPQLIVTPGGDHISALYDEAILDAIAAVAKG